MFLLFSSMLGLARLLGVVSFTGSSVGTTYYNGSSIEYGNAGNLTIGGNTTSIETLAVSVGMSSVIASGVLTLLVTSVALAVALGITVLGSGLNSVSIMAAFKMASLMGLWALFSLLAVVMFMEIPLFGLPLYFLLTLFYTVGVVGTIGFMG